jgi:hypothetical protein
MNRAIDYLFHQCPLFVIAVLALLVVGLALYLAVLLARKK